MDKYSTLYVFNSGQITNPIIDTNKYNFDDRVYSFLMGTLRRLTHNKRKQVYGFVTNYPIKTTVAFLQIKQYNTEPINLAIFGYSLVMLKKFLTRSAFPTQKISKVEYEIPEFANKTEAIIMQNMFDSMFSTIRRN